MINWKIKIIPICLAEKRVSISVTRTDDLGTPESEDDVVWNYMLKNVFVDIDTYTHNQIVTAISNKIWNAYQDYLTQTNKINNFISTYENDISTNLEGKE